MVKSDFPRYESRLSSGKSYPEISNERTLWNARENRLMGSREWLGSLTANCTKAKTQERIARSLSRHMNSFASSCAVNSAPKTLQAPKLVAGQSASWRGALSMGLAGILLLLLVYLYLS